MPEYRIVLTTSAWAYITVEAPDREEAIERAFESTPYLCAQCGGWGRDNESLELGDVWDVVEDEN